MVPGGSSPPLEEAPAAASGRRRDCRRVERHIHACASKAALLATANFCKVVVGGSSPPSGCFLLRRARRSYLLEEPPTSASMRLSGGWCDARVHRDNYELQFLRKLGEHAELTVRQGTRQCISSSPDILF
jgi:hypothetical protein